MARDEQEREKAEAEDARETDDVAATIQHDSLPSPGKPEGAAWGRPFARVDHLWTRWEAWLCAAVLLTEVIVMSLWVALKGLSTPPDAGNAGLVFRALFGAIVLGLAAFFATKKSGQQTQRFATVGAVLVGLFAAKLWQNVGIDWSTNLLNWYQQASALTLVGGLRGVGTRLTLLLALLGGSLATASGKHITIDLVTRFVSSRVRLPMVVTGWVGSAVICGAASWGFFDHIAIEDFGAKADAPASAKFSAVKSVMSEDFFIARKQASLDLKSFPRVVKGERYSEWLSGKEWNAWLDDSGFAERYGKEKVEAIKMRDETLKRSPIVVVPERGEPRGELIKAANLVFPIGLLIMALRFLLLSVLAISGHLSVEPEVEGSDLKQRGDFGDDDESDGAPPDPKAADDSQAQVPPKNDDEPEPDAKAAPNGDKTELAGAEPGEPPKDPDDKDHDDDDDHDKSEVKS